MILRLISLIVTLASLFIFLAIGLPIVICIIATATIALLIFNIYFRYKIKKMSKPQEIHLNKAKTEYENKDPIIEVLDPEDRPKKFKDVN